MDIETIKKLLDLGAPIDRLPDGRFVLSSDVGWDEFVIPEEFYEELGLKEEKSTYLVPVAVEHPIDCFCDDCNYLRDCGLKKDVT